MNYSKPLGFLFALAALAVPNVHAATITSILAPPTSSLTTNQYDASYPSSKLYDGTAPTLGEIGTVRTNDGGDWAVTNSNLGPQYVVYNMGSTVSFSSILYSQRGFGGAHDWSTVELWVSNIDPGTPTVAGDGSRDGVHVSPITLAQGTTNGPKLTQYDLTGDGSALSGQYVTFKFAPVGPGGNPGGSDLWLAAVPEPSAAVLAGLGLLGLVGRRRRV